MVVFPNAKINLGLNIMSRRPDGYHELETCFYPVPWQEALEIVEAKKTTFTSSGIKIHGEGDNICLKAYQLLTSDYDIPPVNIHLHKAIPIGAGLGGGSADGAFTLKLINNLFSLGLSESQLIQYATKLGADCTFFIKNKPMFAKGIGEKLEVINISIAGKYLFLVYPDIHISTKEAYASIIPKKPVLEINQIIEKIDLYEWKDHLINDFESSLFKTYPMLKAIKQELYEAGAIYASMSGSGSCMFGIYDEAPKLSFPSRYNIWSGKI